MKQLQKPIAILSVAVKHLIDEAQRYLKVLQKLSSDQYKMQNIKHANTINYYYLFNTPKQQVQWTYNEHKIKKNTKIY